MIDKSPFPESAATVRAFAADFIMPADPSIAAVIESPTAAWMMPVRSGCSTPYTLSLHPYIYPISSGTS